MSSEERLEHLDDEDLTRRTSIPFKRKQDPSDGHAVPFVTGHRYYIHWASGIDFTQFQVDRSERWTQDDLPIHFVTNHTEIREAFNVTAKSDG